MLPSTEGFVSALLQEANGASSSIQPTPILLIFNMGLGLLTPFLRIKDQVVGD